MTRLLDTAVDEARDEIVRVGTSLFARGYVHAGAGNISARVGDRHLITPTDAALGFLEPDRLALVDASGGQGCSAPCRSWPHSSR
jgi:3-dehydro-4-phosphotetronate decarboxylase